MGKLQDPILGAGVKIRAHNNARTDFMDVVGADSSDVVQVGDATYGGGVNLNHATVKINGTAMTATATELSTLAGVTAGTVTAGKAIVTTTNKHIDALVITDSGLALGAGAGTPITKTGAQINALVGGVAGSYLLARGEIALDGGNPTPVPHGLTTCVAFTATLKGTAAPGDSTSVLTANINGANVDVYAWKHTTGGAAGNPTLVASTGTETFYWIAIGV